MYKKASRFRQTLRNKGISLTGGTGSGRRALHKSRGHGKPKSKLHKALDASASARQERAMVEIAKKPWKLVPRG
jgi:hypothetical protein